MDVTDLIRHDQARHVAGTYPWFHHCRRLVHRWCRPHDHQHRQESWHEVVTIIFIAVLACGITLAVTAAWSMVHMKLYNIGR